MDKKKLLRGIADLITIIAFTEDYEEISLEHEDSWAIKELYAELAKIFGKDK